MPLDEEYGPSIDSLAQQQEMEEIRGSPLDSNPESPQAVEQEARGSNEDNPMQGPASTELTGPTRQSKPSETLVPNATAGSDAFC